MDITEIEKFANDENAWYFLKLPTGTSQDGIMKIKKILDKSKIKGTFLVATEDFKIIDITKYIKENIKVCINRGI